MKKINCIVIGIGTLISCSVFADVLPEEQLCNVLVGGDGQMISLSSSKLFTIQTDIGFNEILSFDNGSQVILNEQTESIQESVKNFYDEDYNVSVCVSSNGRMAPVYKRN